VIVLAIDSAKRVKDRGWSVWGNLGLQESGTGRPPQCRVDWVVGERAFFGGMLKGKSLITFCTNNGFQIRDANDTPNFGYAALEVREWKAACFPGREDAPKRVFTNLLRREFAPITNPDQLDAIGIGWGAIRLGPAFLKKRELK